MKYLEALGDWAVILLLAVAVFLATIIFVHAQEAAHEGHHGAEHSKLHHWYAGLLRPDTGGSCCSSSDCTATQGRMVNGKWQAKKDGRWIDIPDSKIVRNAESFNTSAHICAPPSVSMAYPPDYVFCFVRPGAGL